MNMPCDVIQDLLPLYVENLASKGSIALIEEHVNGCDSCRKQFENMKESRLPLPDNRQQEIPLRLVKKDIKKRKINAVLLAGLSVFLIMFTAFAQLTKPVYVPYSDSFKTIIETADGSVYANFSSPVTAYHEYTYLDPDSGKATMNIEAWTSTWDRLLGKGTQTVLLSSAAAPVDVVYYCDYTDGGNMTVIYGQDQGENGGVITLPRLVLGYYVVISAVAAGIAGLLWKVFRKKKAGGFCKYTFLAPLSYLIGHILVKGFNTLSFAAGRDFVMILIASAAVYGIIAFGLLLVKQVRQDGKL
jgi:hypothetical protein